MQTEEAQKNFLSKITSLTISKSKSVENFLIYVEAIFNDDNVIGQDHKEVLRDATLRELTKVTCRTFTTTLLTYKISFEKTGTIMTIEDLIARARKAYKAEKSAGTWNDTTFTKTPKAHDEQTVALRAEINGLKQNRLMQTPFRQGNQESSERAPDWGKGNNFPTKPEFCHWKWSPPNGITEPTWKNNKNWWFCTRCGWRTGHTAETFKRPEGMPRRK